MAELGRPWALVSGYDIAFLHHVMCALEEAPLETLPCTALPFKKLPVRRLSPQNRRWLAAFNILLVEQKCHDDVIDEGGWKGRLGLRVLSGQVERAVKVLTETDFPLEKLLNLTSQQKCLEQAKVGHLEHLAKPTSVLLGEVFANAGQLTGHPELTNPLRHLGQGLGAAIYLKDAIEDVEKDRRSNQFNAVECCENGASAAAVLSREHGRALYGLRNLYLPAKEQHILESLMAQLLLEQEVEPPQPRAQTLMSPRRRHSQLGIIDDLCCACCANGGAELCAHCSAEACCNGAAFCPCDCAACCSGSSKTSTTSGQAPIIESPPGLPCPACGSELVACLHGTVEIDECRKCYGLWLDHGELEALSQLKSLPSRLTRPKTVVAATRPEGTRPCPHCAEILVGTKVKGVRLDLCTECQGLWLDQGELNHLLVD